MSINCALALFVALAMAAAQPSTRSPMIGLISQSTSDSLQTHYTPHAPHRIAAAPAANYLDAAYVKWIEAGGSRAVPISRNSTAEEVATLFTKLNGVVFVGGNAEYDDIAKQIFTLARAANDAGDYFPIWGTCLGFEYLIRNVAGEVLTHFDSEKLSCPLNFTADAHPNSSLVFGGALGVDLSGLQQFLTSNAVAPNYHTWGIGADAFASNKDLSSFFKVLATSNDRQNKTFVAMIEGIKYPFFGSQFHPEMAWDWEWDVLPASHSEAWFAMSGYFSRFVAREARKSKHTFASEAEMQGHVIYNIPVAYEPGNDQVYYF